MENCRVIWREGLFIRPQHFQQNDRHFDLEIMNRTKSLISNNWGFFKLEIDEHLLNSGKILIKHASGIFQDGTLFEVNSQNNTLLVDITSKDVNKILYLSLPIYIPQSDEIHFDEHKNIQTRFKSRTLSNVPNINTGESSNCELLVADYNYKLSFEEELDSYVSLPVCKVSDISISGTISLDKEFSPIFLYFNFSNLLLSQMKELLSSITFRAEKLSEKITNTVMKTTEIGDYLLLQLLNKVESELNFLLTQDKVHPERIFFILVSFTSELAVFMKKEKRLLSQINYNHQKQHESFKNLLQELKSMLVVVLEQNSIVLPINKAKYGIYVASINSKDMIDNSTFVFSVSSDISSNKVREILEVSLKFGTVETIRNLVNYHLVGYQLKPLSNAPKEIPYKVNHLYFKLELNEENIEELKRSSGFAFHLSTEIPNIEFTLWAIKNN
ncbi:type VI secretion system baseplate subunit TssK [Aliarcobacter skirrowii]|uniref:Type VI secretion system baseplate subunit TssK n=2 Tax=Aliarcobacter skirrowii TaxID=28200 RepID=A0AAD0SQM8_9BACT|nr:type VI secretion system baseplate subunit TssK [Aliarcobacter skirrowii]AXX84630.1 type VI secretion system, baseplate protein [Aliarcobacter skirrowii CCUG 10374]KAB0619472.1 type VI secretion system baseplate subunit TssK [Aliarcobacter skirrowii CCUG 10374]MDX4028677.1 type VI secretion system baseplate subunit TssK [Aliarcobacter skirrowii]MDX4070036.1 type VI secretion system baseplate subunit TssK [Aliarcobacter skirrowii]RXI24692.1 type VI secretion system baseplate subunit TssK [Al